MGNAAVIGLTTPTPNRDSSPALEKGAVCASRSTREGIARLVRARGLGGAARALDVSIGVVLRLHGGLGVRRGSLHLVKAKLAEIETP